MRIVVWWKKTLQKKRLPKSRRCELGAHVVAGLLQWRDCGITKSRDQITRRAEDGCPFVLKAGCFSPSKRARPGWSHCAASALEGKVGRRRAEDGHHKMGAHEAGRVACHASSPEWAVKSATCTFLSIETVIFLRLLLFTKWMCLVLSSLCCFLWDFHSLHEILWLLHQIASHPLRHTASAFEVCCHVALRHVLYSAAEIVCTSQMRHSEVNMWSARQLRADLMGDFHCLTHVKCPV